MPNRYPELIARWTGKRVLVVGDVMLDRTTYVHGRKPSPEDGEVDAWRVTGIGESLGGAGNAAANLASLGAEVQLIGAVGRDPAATTLGRLLSRKGVLGQFATTAHDRTTVKDRVSTEGRTLIRLDHDMQAVHGLDGVGLGGLLSAALDHEPVGLLLSDYSKGVLKVPSVREYLEGHHVPHSVLDPRRSMVGGTTHVDAVTPNRVEAAMLGGATATRQRFFEHIPGLQAMVETQGPLGASVVLASGGHVGVATLPVRDPHVCGAGDTFAAALLLARVAGSTWYEAAFIANAAARAAVLKPGTCTVTPEELLRSLRELCADS